MENGLHFNHNADFTAGLAISNFENLIFTAKSLGMKGTLSLPCIGFTESQFDEMAEILSKRFARVKYCFEIHDEFNIILLMD